MDFVNFCKYQNVSRETFEQICSYVEILSKWNKKINLISKDDLNDIWFRHILDSSQLVSKIKPYQEICDIGSGNGLPAIILAIILKDNKFTLVETREKRTIFLLNVLQSLDLTNVSIVNNRIENLEIVADVVTARAFSSLNNLFSLCQNLTVKDKFLLMKGENLKLELDEALKNWQFNYQTFSSITNLSSHIIEIYNVQKI